MDYTVDLMKYEIPIRITVDQPLAGVTLRVQKGRDELVLPTIQTLNATIFDLTISVDLNGGKANFLGKFVQGPKEARFIYINSGKRAGQSDSCWDRRAKISLMNITAEQIEKVSASPNTALEAKIAGIGRDGGPSCASVKLLGDSWIIGKRT